MQPGAVPTNLQLRLFGAEGPAIDATLARAERRVLAHDAWLEYVPGWLSGDQQVFADLLSSVHFHQEERTMYDRQVVVPRLYAVLPQDGPVPTVLEQARKILSARYGEEFPRLSLGYYRTGRDGVAWHGDYVARRLPSALVATISIGAPRRFYLRPKGGGQRLTFHLGWGDLLVMGGSCQRTWEHCVPKVKSAGPRMAIMYRPIWEEPS